MLCISSVDLLARKQSVDWYETLSYESPPKKNTENNYESDLEIMLISAGCKYCIAHISRGSILSTCYVVEVPL